MDKKKVALLSTGHFATDINSGALPAVLPFLRDSLNLSYQATGGIMFAQAILSAFTQPVFGLLADHFKKPWLIPAGVILAGLGLCCTGLVGSYYGVLFAVAISGLGAALFHPPAARMANQAGGEKKGLAMSLFSIGGNAGFVIGPPLAVLLVNIFGLTGTVFFGAMSLVMALTLTVCVLRASSPAPKAEAAEKAVIHENNWNQFGRLSVVIIVRSVLLTGLMTYVPLYLMQYFGTDKSTAALGVTVLGFFGVASNIVGGFLSDRVGYGRILRFAFVPLPFLLVLLAVTDAAWIVWLLMPVFGYCTYFAYGSSVVLGQQFLARNIAFASGVTMGLATAMGGMCSPILGWVGDTWGLHVTFFVMAGIAVIGVLAVFLIDPRVNSPSLAREEK